MGNKLSDFYNLLNSLEGKEYLKTFISYNISLISAKIKPSVTLNFIKNDNKGTYNLWKSYGNEILKELELGYVELRETESSVIVLIYDSNLIEKVISKNKAAELLESVGYDLSGSINEIIYTLKQRYDIYKCPHELGIFLGYPVEDVKDFMNCSDKKCITCGYWKVYNKPNKARTVFALYDNVKEHTVDNILSGNVHLKLSNILRERFESHQKVVF